MHVRNHLFFCIFLNLNLFIIFLIAIHVHNTKKPVTTMLTYPWKCAVLHCNHLGNTWKPLVLMTRHFDYCPSASEGDNQSVSSSAPVVSRCFPGGYNVKLYISRGMLAWWSCSSQEEYVCPPVTWTDYSPPIGPDWRSDALAHQIPSSTQLTRVRTHDFHIMTVHFMSLRRLL